MLVKGWRASRAAAWTPAPLGTAQFLCRSGVSLYFPAPELAGTLLTSTFSKDGVELTSETRARGLTCCSCPGCIYTAGPAARPGHSSVLVRKTTEKDPDTQPHECVFHSIHWRLTQWQQFSFQVGLFYLLPFYRPTFSRGQRADIPPAILVNSKLNVSASVICEALT